MNSTKKPDHSYLLLIFVALGILLAILYEPIANYFETSKLAVISIGIFVVALSFIFLYLSFFRMKDP